MLTLATCYFLVGKLENVRDKKYSTKSFSFSGGGGGEGRGGIFWIAHNSAETQSIIDINKFLSFAC